MAVLAIPKEIQALYAIKQFLPIQVDYYQDSNNEYSCFTRTGIKTWGHGADYNEACRDLIHALKDYADMYIKDFSDWVSHNPEELPYILRVIMSSDEELREWLNGQKCEDI